MKSKIGLLIGICSLGFTHNTLAASVLTFAGTVSQLYQGTGFTAASGELLSHYTTSGIGVGQTMQFQVHLDPARQGQITNEDGSITTLSDLPVVPNCDLCYGSSGAYYDYAELIASTVDLSQSSYFSGQKSYSLATSNYNSGMATDYHSGEMQLGDYLKIDSLRYGDLSALVYNWAPSSSSDYSFNLYFDDGAGLVRSYGTLQLVSAEAPTVPIPAAAWLMGSGLLGLAGIGYRRKQAV